MSEIRFIDDNARRFSMRDNESIVQISKQWFYNFLECLPPMKYACDHSWFAVGEAERYVPFRDDMTLGYTLCFQHQGKYYATQPLPVMQMSINEIYLFIQHTKKQYKL